MCAKKLKKNYADEVVPKARTGWWDAGRMKQAIQQFRDTGKYGSCMDLLDIGEGQSLLLVLQQALSCAGSIKERDAFEDISFYVSKKVHPKSADGIALKLRKGIRDAYGEYAERFIDIDGFAAGVVALSKNIPPIEALVAAGGLEAEKKLKETMLVDADALGETYTRYRNNCKECKGKDPSPFALPCRCHREIAVPYDAKDGQIVKGIYKQSGEDYYCCLRLKG